MLKKHNNTFSFAVSILFYLSVLFYKWFCIFIVYFYHLSCKTLREFWWSCMINVHQQGITKNGKWTKWRRIGEILKGKIAFWIATCSFSLSLSLSVIKYLRGFSFDFHIYDCLVSNTIWVWLFECNCVSLSLSANKVFMNCTSTFAYCTCTLHFAL